jgi:hypothetical protein
MEASPHQVYNPVAAGQRFNSRYLEVTLFACWAKGVMFVTFF